MWDGDQMVQEAPLRLDGTIDETSAIRWHYEEGDYTPLAKQLPSGELHYIVTDHLGTPKEMFDETGDLVWSASHYVWGAVRAAKMYGGGAGVAPAWQGKQGASLAPARERAQAEGAVRELICPFRFPGQYEDVETGLNYNRHRYYDALTGQYCSPDPIGLAGGDRPQGYVDRPGSWVDPLGLAARANYQKPAPTASANWNTARSNYWKAAAERARDSGSRKYSPANLNRMEKGQAPQMLISVRNRKTGEVGRKTVPIELHHNSLTQRGAGARANESWNLVEVSPTAHEGMDQFRHTGYDLIKVLKGPNSW